MKKHSNSAIILKFEQVWESEGQYPHIEISENGQELVEVVVSDSHSPGLTYDQLCEISDFFDTKAINVETSHESGSCDTCDYGSEYTLTFVIKPEGASK